MSRIPGMYVYGTIPKPQRSELPLDSNAVFDLPLECFRVHDAYATLLPGTPASDDLGLVGGTFGTGVPSLETHDLKTLTQSLYGRIRVTLPPEYQAGETVSVKVNAGMVTTVADGSAVVDVEAYMSDDFGAKDGSDLVTTAAQSINNLTPAEKTFVLNSTGLSPGDQLDIRVKVAVVDAATATAVKARIGRVSLLCDIRG